jgi:arsenite transporter
VAIRLQIVFLCLAIAAMFASQGVALREQPSILFLLLLPLLLFFVVNFILGSVVCRLVSFDSATCISLCFATLARNSPIALAVAVTAFPDHPLIALTLVIGPLIELPALWLVAQIWLNLRSFRFDFI